MKNTHLSLEDRKRIQERLGQKLYRTQMLKILIKTFLLLLKKLKPRNLFNNPITCTKFKECNICHGKCSDISKCILDKYFYYAKQAHENYVYTIKDAKEETYKGNKCIVVMLETNVDLRNSFVFNSTSKNKTNSGLISISVWIDTSTGLVLKSKFEGKNSNTEQEYDIKINTVTDSDIKNLI